MIAPLWRKAAALMSVAYASMVEYRGELFFWMIATILPLIMMGPWMVAGRTGSFPLDEAGFARYFVAVFVIRQLSISWVIYEFEFLVVSGRLSTMLLVPIDPGWRFLVAHLAEQAARLPFVVLMVALALWLFPQALEQPGAAPGSEALWWPTAAQVGLAVLATYLAFLVRFLLQYTLAMGAFWVERIVAFDRLLMIPYIYLSGLVAPLEVFPEPVREAVLWTPFPYLVWFPASLLAGADVGPPWRGLATVGAWALAILLLNRALWRAGLKRFSAMGA